MQVNDYILSNISSDPTQNVLEIGPWHGFLSDALYANDVNITASEVLDDAYIWQRQVKYPCHKLTYSESLKLKRWDIVIATNVIHHMHSPFHFLEETMKHSNRLIISSVIFTDKIYIRDPEKWGPNLSAIVLPLNDHKSFIEQNGWTITHCDINHTDFKERQSWIIDAKKSGIS